MQICKAEYLCSAFFCSIMENENEQQATNKPQLAHRLDTVIAKWSRSLWGT